MTVYFRTLRAILSSCAILFVVSVNAFAGIPLAERQASTVSIDRTLYPETTRDWHLNSISDVAGFPSLNSFRGIINDPKKADFNLYFYRHIRIFNRSHGSVVTITARIVERATGITRLEVSHQSPEITWSGGNNEAEYTKLIQAVDHLLRAELTGVGSHPLNRDLLYGGHLEKNDNFPFDSNVFKYTHGEHSMYVQTNDPKLAQKLSQLVAGQAQKQLKAFIGFMPTGSSDPSLIKFVVLQDMNKEVLFPSISK
jgi:hypothetical protein